MHSGEIDGFWHRELTERNRLSRNLLRKPWQAWSPPPDGATSFSSPRTGTGPIKDWGLGDFFLGRQTILGFSSCPHQTVSLAAT